MTTFSVNEALEYSDGLAGRQISVRGLFSFAFENISLFHVPVADQAPGYGSSMWISVDDGGLGLDRQPRVTHRRRRQRDEQYCSVGSWTPSLSAYDVADSRS